MRVTNKVIRLGLALNLGGGLILYYSDGLGWRLGLFSANIFLFALLSYFKVPGESQNQSNSNKDEYNNVHGSFSQEVKNLEVDSFRNQNQIVAKELLADFRSIMDGLSGKFQPQCFHVKNEVGQMREILNDSVIKLGHHFKSLEANTGEQREIVVMLAKQTHDRDENSQSIDFGKFVNKTAEILSLFVENIVNTSKSSMELVEKMDDISRTMNIILKDIQGVEKIANQTKILALNASIEASKAGKAGLAFSVVADEVRKLAADSNRFSQQIRVHTQEAQKVLKKTQLATDELASKDMSFALMAKANVTDMMEKVKGLNEIMTKSIEEISRINVEIKANVVGAVTALQFEDMVAQVGSKIFQRIETMEGLLRAIGNSGDILEESSKDKNYSISSFHDHLMRLKEILKETNLLFEQVNRVSVSQQSVSAGTIDLF